MDGQTCYTRAMAYTLALDCSLGGLHVALAASGNAVPLFAHASTAPRAADSLHEILHNFMEEKGINLADVDTFVATVGPGSFTGIRMGLAVGHALKLVTPGLRLIGLGTLEVLAANLVAGAPPKAPFTLVTDAAGASLYVQHFAADGTAEGPALCQPACDVTVGAPVYAPATLMLDGANVLPPLEPASLLRLAAQPARHMPFQPVYVKPLAYKATA